MTSKSLGKNILFDDNLFSYTPEGKLTIPLNSDTLEVIDGKLNLKIQGYYAPTGSNVLGEIISSYNRSSNYTSYLEMFSFTALTSVSGFRVHFVQTKANGGPYYKLYINGSEVESGQFSGGVITFNKLFDHLISEGDVVRLDIRCYNSAQMTYGPVSLYGEYKIAYTQNNFF